MATEEEQARAADRDLVKEMEDDLRKVRDRAHWLGVHQRMDLAKHIEDVINAALSMTYDLKSQAARGVARRR